MRPQQRGKPMVIVGAVTAASMMAMLGLLLIVFAAMAPGEPKDPTRAPVVSPGKSVHVAAGRVILLPYVGGTTKGDGLSHSGMGADLPYSSGRDNRGDCHISDSNGARPDVTGEYDLHIRRSGSEYAASGDFSADAEGAYTIRCGNRPTMVLDSSVTDPPRPPDLLAAAGISLIAIILAEAVGVVLLIIGIVRVGRSKRKIEEFDRRAGSTWPR